MKYIRQFESVNNDLIRFGEFHQWHTKLNKMKYDIEMSTVFDILELAATDEKDERSEHKDIPLFSKKVCQNIEKSLSETKKDYDEILNIVKLLGQENGYEGMIFTIKPYGIFKNDYKCENTKRDLNINDSVFELYIGLGNITRTIPAKEKWDSLQKINIGLFNGVSDIIKTLSSKGSKVEVNLFDDSLPHSKFKIANFENKYDSYLLIIFNLPY